MFVLQTTQSNTRLRSELSHDLLRRRQKGARAGAAGAAAGVAHGAERHARVRAHDDDPNFPLQTAPGVYNEKVFKALDFVLVEVSRLSFELYVFYMTILIEKIVEARKLFEIRLFTCLANVEALQERQSAKRAGCELTCDLMKRISPFGPLRTPSSCQRNQCPKG